MPSNYIKAQKEKLAAIKSKKDIFVLGIETSCDETAASVVKNGRDILSNVVFSQIPMHTLYGGVVPEIASRAHTEKIDIVVSEALKQSGLDLSDIDAIAVTKGPGLVGALLVGVSYAKALAYASDKPLIGVNHIEGHICANYLSFKDLNPPGLCLVVSGGHSHIIDVDANDSYTLVGCTQDDAAGEAFDKAARVLGLGYPGGPKLDAVSKTGDDSFLSLPHPKTQGKYDFSFSGLKTAFINTLHNMQQKNIPYSVKDCAASFQKAVVDLLVEKTMLAVQDKNVDTLLIAGGVSANSLLRKRFTEECQKTGTSLYMPELFLCGDNAAMIAAAGHRQLLKGNLAELSLNAEPALKLI
ncbi:MAG: tRNA (adenosine(37)-N6)-threonylcarbamoyltransferase complex transferase subunit TsaD [Eubacteriales bacterium]|nr:tRNA (adenosine(37)-N6)-threonylcarbamoyltransferase complex transferase subunit TsaD [Eubacteriales bacterium]